VGLEMVRHDRIHVRSPTIGIEQGHTHLVNLRTMTITCATNVEPIRVIMIEAVGLSLLQNAITLTREREIITKWK
jgi:hypothetical protein